MDSFETNLDMIAPNSSDSSPIRPFKTVEQSFPELEYSPQVFTSPRINPKIQSSSLQREYSKPNGDKNDDIAPVICTPGKLKTDLSNPVNSHNVGQSSNNSADGEGGIGSESPEKYLKYLFKVISDDDSSLKQSGTATPSSNDFAECINYNSLYGEQNNGHVRTEVSQPMPDVPTHCLQYDEIQQESVDEICGSVYQLNAATFSRSFANESQVLGSSCTPIDAPPNSVELENISKATSSMFHAPIFGRSSIAVPKPSGIGLHLNSILNSLPMDCGASVKSAEGNFMTVQGKMSLCTTDSHSTENTKNSSTSSKAIDGSLKPTEQHSISCGRREYAKLSPQKKRKRSMGEGDGCKRCNCKKTKCLKLYCDCFAAGYYCGETCSCQGCFNSPEYEDTVLDTRKKIVSRNPLAFVPKTFQHAGESPASNIQDINKATPFSVRHKRGCNCKKSRCLKRYCECYQSNVGCSDGCRCDGCQNVYGKKEEYDVSQHHAIPEATNDIPEISFDQELDTLCSKLSIPHNMTPFTPLLQYSDLGKDALHTHFPYTRCGQSPEADIALSATHKKPSICQTIPNLVSSEMQLYNCNSKMVDDFLPHRGKMTKVLTSCQSSPESGSFSALSSPLCSTSMISVFPSGQNKLLMDLDSNSRCYNISEDDDMPEILKEHPISFSEGKVRSPNKKRVSSPHDRCSSMTGLGGGRKFTLKAVPAFPPVAPCTNVKSTSGPSEPDLNSNNSK
ncbi:protein tesmin/TSO1-like CXC 2 isoform X2 [Apium graveolens]|uniref:protein tesmin/TSO1-like CXC 2 isoform X2 n=1 Tax=Apium graveolens TaxID=4045 RepID=UPI003D7A5620